MPIDPRTGRFVLPGEEPEQEEEFSFLPDTDDVLLFAPRGVEKLGRATVSLLSGGRFGDPSPENGLFVDRIAETGARVLGAKDPRFRTSSFIGAFAEGAVQFAVPFSLATKGLRAAGFLVGAEANALLAANNARKAGLAAVGIRAARGTVAGAVADFVAFDAHEGRLSDLLNTIPELDPLVPDFLASDENDTELGGRIKNVLEGAGLGFAVDTILGGLRAVRFARQRRQTGRLNDKRVREVEAEVGKKAQEMMGVVREAEASSEALAVSQLTNDPAPSARQLRRQEFVRKGQERAQRRAQRGSAQEAALLTERRLAAERQKVSGRVREAMAGTELRETLEKGDIPGVAQHLLELDLGPRFRARAMKNFERYAEADPETLEKLLGDPRKLSKEVKELIGMATSGGLNLSQYVDVDVSGIKLVRAIESVIDATRTKLKRTRKSDQQAILEGLAKLQQDLALSPEQMARYSDEFIDLTKEVEVRAEANRWHILSITERAGRIATLLRDGLNTASPDDLAELGIVNAARQGPEAVAKVLDTEIDRLALIDLGHSRGIGNVAATLRMQQTQHALDLLELAGIDPTSPAPLSGLGKAEFQKRIEVIASLSNFQVHERISALQRIRKMRQENPGKAARLMTSEWIVSALLHSPKTAVTNAVFPFFHAFWVPIEGMVGGSILFARQAVVGGNTARSAEAVVDHLHTITGMVSSIPEAAKMARRAFREGPIFNPRNQRRDLFPEGQGLLDRKVLLDVWGDPSRGEWSPKNAHLQLIGYLGQGVGINLPGRIMRSTDEFTKTMAGMGLVKARLARQARRQGKDVSSYISESLPLMFDNGRARTQASFERRALELAATEQRDGQIPRGELTKRRQEIYEGLLKDARFEELNPIITEALERADEVTSTAPVRDDGLVGGIKQFLRSDPIVRVFIPFFSTPVNLVKAAGQRLDAPLSVPSYLFKRFKDNPESIERARLRNVKALLSNDINERTLAYGRLATGAALMMTVTHFARQGIITGSGPSDKERRDVMRDAGWLPYSLNLNGKYVQYLRADPFATVVGIIADMVETMKVLGDEGVGPIEQNIMGTWMSIANNLTDKTYLSGVAQLMDAISTPERAGAKFIASTALSAVPRTFQQLAPFIQEDPVLRDTYTLLDRIRARLPFFSEGAPPLRNVLGEPVERVSSLGSDPGSPAGLWYDMFVPIAYREVKDDVIHKEFGDLSYGFSPPRRQRLNVEIADFVNASGQDAYDRWAELHGKVRIEGVTLRQALRRVIQSSDYQRLPKESTSFEDTPRVRLLKSVIDRYRREAWEQTLTEYPDLSREYRSRQQDQRLLRSGGRPDDLIRKLGI